MGRKHRKNAKRGKIAASVQAVNKDLMPTTGFDLPQKASKELMQTVEELFEEDQPDKSSMKAECMSLKDVIEQMESLKDNAKSFLHDPPEPDDDVWLSDIKACDAVTAILTALRDEDITDAAEVRDLLFDYNLLAKQYQAMREKYEAPSAPYRMGEAEFCPQCNKRLSIYGKRCANCGQRISGR